MKRLINYITFAFILFLGIIIVAGILRYKSNELSIFNFILFFMVPGIGIGALLFSFVLPIAFRTTSIIVLLSSLLSVYGFEAYQDYLQFNKSEIIGAADLRGIKYDSRTNWQVIADLRAKGENVYPSEFVAGRSKNITVDGKRVHALAGHSNVKTILCNEYGEFVDYLSDEHGFNNPPGLWTPKDLSVLILGDSYTHGYCSPRPKTIVGQIRQKIPKTITLGNHSSGPLWQLAAFREYGRPLRPKNVVWFYSEYDFVDLRMERHDQRLNRYLDPKYSAGLISKQKEIDQHIEKLVSHYMPIFNKPNHKLKTRLKRAALLRSTRHILGFNFRTSNDTRNDIQFYRTLLPLYRRILNQVKNETESWGGQLWMVYLPAKVRFLKRAQKVPTSHMRDDILKLWEGMDINTVDLVPSFLNYQGNSNQLVFHLRSHYSEVGNKLVANAVVKRLLSKDPVRKKVE